MARAGLAVLLAVLIPVSGFANGGPFVLKYPGGDPAAKGVLARLDPDLQPARESRLGVIQEELAIRFEPEWQPGRANATNNDVTPPIVAVTADYLITNPTPDVIEVDFGFPILRGIYISPFSMMPMPDAQVRVDGTNYLRPELISNSAIYGILRSRAEQTIDRGLKDDPALARMVESVRAASAGGETSARKTLTDHLTKQKGWSAAEAVLFAEYVALRPAAGGTNQAMVLMPGKTFWWGGDSSISVAAAETAWAVKAIGEQKATQWLAVLAGKFDPAAAAGYEAIFASWGGDVRERSIDLQKRTVRPREISLRKPVTSPGLRESVLADADPTVYARVDYFKDDAMLTDGQRASWNSVIQRLPVVFTFSPMNLLHYRVTFEPGAARTVSVSYRQHAYLDTANPRSYQVAYVVHPASLWDSFGPIHLTATSLVGAPPVSSIAMTEDPGPPPSASPQISFYPNADKLKFKSHKATLTDKKGELFVGIDADAWDKAASVLPNSAVIRGSAGK